MKVAACLILNLKNLCNQIREAWPEKWRLEYEARGKAIKS
jgi:hypothetical protein